MDARDKVLLKITTPENIFFEGDIKYVSVKIAKGYSTFLPNHSPVISFIQPSLIKVGGKDKWKEAIISNGVISVTPEFIQIITNNIVWVKDIDVKLEKKKLNEYNEELEKISDNKKSEKERLLEKIHVIDLRIKHGG